MKFPSESIVGDQDLEMELDMNNSECNKGLKDVKMMIVRDLTVRNREYKQEEGEEESKGLMQVGKGILQAGKGILQAGKDILALDGQ